MIRSSGIKIAEKHYVNYFMTSCTVSPLYKMEKPVLMLYNTFGKYHCFFTNDPLYSKPSPPGPKPESLEQWPGPVLGQELQYAYPSQQMCRWWQWERYGLRFVNISDCGLLLDCYCLGNVVLSYVNICIFFLHFQKD